MKDNTFETPDAAFDEPSIKADSSNSEANLPKKEEDKPKKTMETHFREYLAASPDLAVYDAGDARMTMLWKDGRWIPIPANRRKDRAEKFCSGFQSLYRDGVIESCQNLMSTALFNLGKVLKEDKKRHLIATKHRFLEITPEGIRIEKSDRRLFVPIYADIEIDEDRIKLDTYAGGVGSPYFYTLRSTEELEKDTKFGGLIQSLYPDPIQRSVLQEFLGDLLTRMQTQAIVVLEGEGGTGKSVLLKLMSMLVGNAKALNFSRCTPYQLAQIHLCPLVAADEVRGRIDTTLVKQVSGRSLIQAEHKFESPFTFIYEGKMIWAQNEPPRLDDHSSAIEQRMFVFKASANTKRSTDQEIINYENVIFEEEADILLEWCLRGALKVVKRGRLPSGQELGKAILASKEEIGKRSDPLRGFVEEYGMKPCETSAYSKDDLYELLKKWLQKEGRMSHAPMIKDVALGHIKRILEAKHGPGCLGGQFKVSVGHGSTKKRVPAMRVAFEYQVPIQALNRNDVTTAIMEPENHDVVPLGVQEELESREKQSKMTPEEAKKEMEETMKKKGFSLSIDPLTKKELWSKEIDMNSNHPDPFN